MKKNMIIFIAAIGFGMALADISPLYSLEEEFTLEEITVTAQKREENQQKVPVAMEVISSETIKELGMTDIQQVLSDISNVVVARTGDNTMKISIRGIADDHGTFFSGTQASTPTVAMNFDGISSSRTDQGFNLFDLERVEVLFGPQATLYSTNTPGGIVNIITAAPRLEVFEGSGTLEYGSYNLLHTEGVMNAPISDIMAVRASFSTSTHDGYNSNGTNDEDAKSARLRYLFKPNERISFIASGEYLRTSNRGFAAVVPFVNQDDVDNPWTASRPGPPGAPPTPAPTPQPAFTERNKVYGQFEVDAGIGTITLLPAYVTLNSSAAGEHFITGAPTLRDAIMRERSMEMRMASNEDSPFTYILGLSYYKTTDSGYTTADDPPVNSYMDINLQNKSKAAYGNVTYPVTEVFRVTGGLRYSWDEFHSLSVEYPPKGGFPGMPPSIEDGLMEYDGMDYKVGIEYDIGEDVMFYADSSTSYRVQGMAFKWTMPGQPGTPYPPEKLKAYNAGLKSRLFGNRLQLNAAGYFYDYQDYLAMGTQLSVARQDLNGDGDYGDTIGGIPETYIIMDENAREVGDAEAYGVDVNTSMIITNKDKLDVSISYAHKEFVRMFFNYMDITNEIGVPDLDLSGEPMTFAPEWTINANYSHNFSLGNGGILTARVDSKYVSEYLVHWSNVSMNLDPDFQPYLSDLTDVNTQEAYVLSNFTMVYADPSEKWTLSGYVKNIENYAAKLSMPGFGGGGSLFITAPRTYGGILTIRF